MCMEAKQLRQEDDCVWEANAKASVQVKYDATFSCPEKKIAICSKYNTTGHGYLTYPANKAHWVVLQNENLHGGHRFCTGQ